MFNKVLLFLKSLNEKQAFILLLLVTFGFENHRACGFGVCLGCAVPVRSGGFALVCRDGPVFATGDVVWAGLP